ncbi:hypothetical protein [Streptomyces zaomyceticus]|uniref:hypothetical protein n=1 Tax=Streptomyces zaomyceticus TaxID=68286 RepID=UPI00339F4A0A
MSRKAIPAEAFDHGDPRRYSRGCRCDICKKGITAETRRRRYLRATGRALLTTPDRAAAHVESLRAAGMTDAQILGEAALAPDTLYRIVRRSGGLLRKTEARILAIRPARAAGRGSGANVPALGTVRRLRALAADGWTATELGRQAGKHKQFIVHLQNMDEGGQVRMWVADYVRRLQDELAGLAPEDFIAPTLVKRTRQRASAKNWASSAYWDSEDFDDPDFTPALRDDLNVLRLGSHRRREIQHLASFHVPEHEIADRLGMARAYVHDLIRDMGKAA